MPVVPAKAPFAPAEAQLVLAEAPSVPAEKQLEAVEEGLVPAEEQQVPTDGDQGSAEEQLEATETGLVTAGEQLEAAEAGLVLAEALLVSTIARKRAPLAVTEGTGPVCHPNGKQMRLQNMQQLRDLLKVQRHRHLHGALQACLCWREAEGASGCCTKTIWEKVRCGWSGQLGKPAVLQEPE
jgi:hypothetical protein